jgi:hypothetical protein
VIHDFTTWEGYSDDEYHILSNCTFEMSITPILALELHGLSNRQRQFN